MHVRRRENRGWACLALGCCAACGVAEHRVEVLLEHSACSLTCAKPSYALYVHEQRAAGRCARQRATAYGDTQLPELSYAAGSTVLVGVAAACPTAGGASACCALLEQCIASGTGAGVCKEAAAACPAEANPYTGEMKSYAQKVCAAQLASACVECHGEQSLRLAGAAQITVALRKAAVACGVSAEPAAPPCP